MVKFIKHLLLQIHRIALRRNENQFKAEISVFNPNQLVFSMKQALYYSIREQYTLMSRYCKKLLKVFILLVFS